MIYKGFGKLKLSFNLHYLLRFARKFKDFRNGFHFQSFKVVLCCSQTKKILKNNLLDNITSLCYKRFLKNDYYLKLNSNCLPAFASPFVCFSTSFSTFFSCLCSFLTNFFCFFHAFLSFSLKPSLTPHILSLS